MTAEPQDPEDTAQPDVQEADLTALPDQVAAPLTPVGAVVGPLTKPTITDWARIALAGSLIAILAVLTLGTAWFVAVYPSKEPAIESFLKLVFTPIIGLVGSVIGFYFGSRAAAVAGSNSNAGE
jgi:hypothetical protein